MKKLLLLLALSCAVAFAFAQEVPPIGSKYSNTIQGLDAQKYLRVPHFTAPTLNGRPDSVGCIGYNTLDSALYVYKGGGIWKKVGEGTGGNTTIINQQITNYFDSVYNITNLGDTVSVVNTYITQFFDSLLTANAYQTWEGALIEGSDLSRSFNSHIGNNKFAFYSSTNHTASNTTVGALIAPQYNSLIVAPKLHVSLLRGGATITIPQNAYPFQRWRANGYDVFLTLNYNKANGATDGTTNFPTAAQLPQFRGDFRAFLHNFVKGYVDKVALENEENNFTTRPNWNVKDYLAEAGAAIQIFHDSIPTGIITNGGLTGQYLNQWVWRWLKAHSRDSDADTLAKYKFPASQIPNLANWSTIPQFSAGVAKMDSLIAGYATLNWDFVNFHYYEPIIDTTLQTTNTDVFGFIKEALENATGKLAISNEVGQHNSSPLIPVQLLQKAADVGMRYFIWYSADAADGTGAVALQDSSTLLRPNGVAFAALVPSLAPTDTSSKETFSIQQQQIFLQRLKKNYRQQIFIDTTGRLYADTTANGAGAGIYFPPADTVHVTARIDSFTLANAINHPVTLVVHNGSVLRKIGTGIPAPNEVLINSATGGFKLGSYADAGAYIDIVYAPIGTSSGGGGSTSSTLEDVLNNGHILNDAHDILLNNDLNVINGDSTLTADARYLYINDANVSFGSQQALSGGNYEESFATITHSQIRLNSSNDSLAQSRELFINPTAIAVKKNGTTYNLPLKVNNISAGTDNNITLNYLQPSDTTGKWQHVEDQRLSSNNSPNFAGLTSNGIIKLLGLLNTPAAPATATQNMYADSTGAWTIQGSNGFAFSISKARLTGNHRVFVQNKDYTLADSAVVALKLNISDTSTLLHKNDSTIANRVTANTTTIATNTTDIYKRAYASAFEGENGIYLPVIKAAGLESSTGLADHASGGVVASVAGTAGSGNLYLPKPIDPTKAWRCAVLVEINDAQPITELHFSNASNLFSTGLRFTSISTGGITGTLGGNNIAATYGSTGIPAGTKIWVGMASDGVTVTSFLLPDGTPASFQFSTNATSTTYTGAAYTSTAANTATNSTNNVFGYGTQLNNRLCRLTIATKSTTNRIVGVYWAQSLSGPKDGRLQPPAILQNTILQDATAWYIVPGKQGYQPTDLAMILHPNGNVGSYGVMGNGSPAEMAKIYTAGYLMFGITGAYNVSDFAGATSSNWGAGAGMKYRKAQLEWVRSNILGTKNLFLVGQSMGVMDALAFYRQYPGIARGILGISGAYDLSDSYTNRSFSTIIQAGYADWYVNTQAATGIDPSQQVTASANAIVGATTISVSALSAAIPSGTTLTLLSGTGQTTVVTTAAASASATSITVTALTVQVNSGAKYDMTAYWTKITYGYGAPDDSYYASPFVWKNLWATGTVYSINDIIYKAPSGLTVANYKWADPTLQYDIYKNVPIALWHGDADVTIPIAQMTAFASAVNAIGGSVSTVTVSGGTHLSASVYDGTAIVNFLNSLK